jgi:tetratricopeptide (TPR) repeat protein
LKVNYVLDDKGNYVRTFDHRYQILTTQGIEGWSSTGAFWSPWYMERPTVEATVKGEDGTIAKLDPRTVTESAAYPEAPDMYSDAKVLRAPLPSVAVGSIVEEHIVERTKSPFFLGGSSQMLTFQQGIPVDSVELSIDLPGNLPLKYELRDAKVKIQDETKSGRRKIVFSGGPYEALKPIEANVPSDVPAWPYVVFSTSPSWNELTREYHRRISEKLGTQPTLLDLAKVVEGTVSKREKVNRLLEFIHDRVRYVGMEFGEASIIPMQPKETLQRGYGDCKDQSVLLVKLLSEVGVDARVALLRAGTSEDVRASLPAMNAFNHAIVYVPGDDPFWVDPTSSHARAGDIPSLDQGRNALIIDPKTETLVPIASNEAKQNNYHELREVFFDTNGKTRVIEVSTGSGTVEQSLRRAFTAEEDALRKNLKKYVENTYSAKDLGKLNVGNTTDIETPFKVELEAKDVGVASLGLLEGSVALELKPLFSWMPNDAFEDEPRKMDFIIQDPFLAELTYRIHIPEGFVPKKVDHPVDIDLGPAVLKRTLQTGKGNIVEANLALSVSSRRWTPSQLEKFRKGINKLGTQNRTVIEFEHIGQQHIEAHRVREGLDVFRAAQSKSPKSGVPGMRLALNLVDLGYGDVARQIATEAITVEPDNAQLQRGAGAIFSRDELGRAMHQGYDRDKAAAAYKRAADLDEDDIYSRVHGALLYEYDVKGTRYVDQKALETAVKLYDAIDQEKLTNFDGGAFTNNPYYALLWSNQFQVLKERLGKLPIEKTPALLSVVTQTMVADVNAGMGEVDRLGLRGETRSEVLANSGEVLVQMRRYPEAARLVAAAARGSEKSVQYESRARFLEKIKLTDIARMPENTPSAVVQKVIILGFSPSSAQATYLPKLLTKEAQNKDSNVSDTIKSLGNVRDRQKSGAEVLIDVMRAMTSFDVQGDDAIGYRVKVRSEAPGVEVTRFDAFVVKDQGQYRLRALGDGLDEVGQQAVTFIKTNRKKAAESWLRWASEGVSSPSGDDPLRTIAWLRLWKNGKGDPELTAYALCGKLCGSEGTTVLENARSKATDSAIEELDHALAINYWANENGRKLQEVADKMLKLYPKSLNARRWKRYSYWELKDYAALKKQAEKELEFAPDLELAEVYHAMANADSAAGRVKEARATLAKLIELGRADAQAFGNCAWYDLVIGKVTDKTLEYASRAVQMTDFRTANVLHTLAAVYAELGKPEEAKQTLDKLLSLREQGTPDEVDYYVIGRIAENYALKTAAQKAYAKVKKGEEDGPTSTYRLVQQRLKKL